MRSSTHTKYLLIALFAVLGRTAAPAFAQSAPVAEPRLDRGLDSGWRFVREDTPGAEATDFDDSAWQGIDLPHTWNNRDGQDGGNNYYRGIGWYRRHLSPDPSLAGKSLFLKFDGAATVADVYVNGQSVGEHRGNFAAFCFDVTKLLHPGRDNVIAVKVDNSRQQDVPPLSGDFTIFGGLYRDVHLLALNPLSVSPLDDASPGVYVKQSSVKPRSADLEITVKLRNAGTAPAAASVQYQIRDAADHTVATGHVDQTVPAGGDADAVRKLTVKSPHLWNGVLDPYLYRVIVDVRAGKETVDEVVQPLGIRYFQVDPDQGLLLNGKHYALHGVNRHQDRLDKGWAIGPHEHREDYDLIHEMGCTGIRLSHYQHAQTFYDLCDRGGLVVWAELPLVNQLNLTDAFRENARQQLRELIKQNYNHPSILFWSLFNELHFPSGSKNPKEWEQVVQLNDLAHELDPTRLTTAASSIGVDHPVNFITDIIAFNRYYGWYGGKPTDWADALDAMHKKYPTRCFAVSEYGAGASVLQHEPLPPTQPRPGGAWHPEEWQAVVHEDAWSAMRRRPWLWGTFLWAMFDFGSDGRREGDTPGRNDKGMVTYDRKTRKDAFYWYKANWTQDPFVHILSSRFTPRPSGPATIEVYSNCDAVTLIVNGKPLGRLTSPDHRYLWNDASLGLGGNTIEAIGERGGRTYRDACTWEGQTPPPPTPAPAPAPAAKQGTSPPAAG